MDDKELKKQLDIEFTKKGTPIPNYLRVIAGMKVVVPENTITDEEGEEEEEEEKKS